MEDMLWRLAADLVAAAHFAYIIFVAVGSLLAWRRPLLLWLHVPSLVWAVGIVTIGWDCPLTGLERSFRDLAGNGGSEDGFVDRYLENVIFPGELTPVLRAIAAAAIVIGYVGVARTARRARRVTDGGALAPETKGGRPWRQRRRSRMTLSSTSYGPTQD